MPGDNVEVLLSNPAFDINLIQWASDLLYHTWSQGLRDVDLAACRSALQEDPELYATLKDSYLSKSYDHIHGWDSSKIVPHAIRSFLDKIRAPMSHYINGEKVLLAPWLPSNSCTDAATLQHLKSLQIPSNRYSPSLILHELGSFQDDPNLRERASNVFNPATHTLFTNVSGSGKTRILLEGLCCYWGFYFTSTVDSSNLGSRDVEISLQSLSSSSKGFCRVLPPRESSNFWRLVEENRRIAKQFLSQVLLSRLLIFELFLDLGGDATWSDERQRLLKRSWVLLQLFPNLETGCDDIFDSLREKLEVTSQATLDSMIDTILLRIRKHRVLTSSDSGSQPSLFCVLDEAQYAAQELSHAFVSSDSNQSEGSPVLLEIIRTWEQQLVGHGVSMVVTGTKIPKHLFASNQHLNFRWCSDTGAFDDSSREAHKKYLVKYLPPGFSQSASGGRLVERVLYWLRGRHRVTSSFIETLIENNFRRPHSFFNLFYFESANIHPTEAEHFVREEEKTNDTAHFKIGLNYGLGFHYLEEADIPIIRRIATEYTMRSAFSQPTMKNAKRYVGATLAMFTDLDATTATIYEPLIMTRIMDWMGRKHSTTLTYLENELRACPTSSYAFQNLVAYTLFSQIEKQRPLATIFSFPKPTPKWANEGATLVGICRSELGEAEVSVFKEAKLGLRLENHVSSACLGRNAPTAQTVREWLDHSFREPFCFPHSASLMGPDILFVLRLQDESLIWVAVEARSDQTRSPSRSTMRNTMARLTPSQFFVEHDTMDRRTPLDQTVKDTRKLLVALPNRHKRGAGRYSLLRVIASPSQVNLNAYLHEDPDSEQHPLAAFNLRLADFPSLEPDGTESDTDDEPPNEQAQRLQSLAKRNAKIQEDTPTPKKRRRKA